MSSPPVVNMNVHYLAAQPAVSLVTSSPDFVALGVSEYPAQVNVFLRTRAECDALVRATLAARDLLPEPVIDPAILNDALAGEAGEQGPGCGIQCPAEPWMRCTRDEGHEGDHLAGGARSVDEPPLTWPQDAALPAYQEPPGIITSAAVAFCAVQHPDGFLCTLPSGHGGDHEAHGGGEMAATWTVTGAHIPATPEEVTQ